MLELGAVGHVQIDQQDRVPLCQKPQHGLHLGRVGLRVVAVQIEILRRCPPSHFLGSNLVGTIPAAEPLVAVDIEDGDEQQRRALERTRSGFPFEHLSKREEAGIFAVDLASVNATLHEHDGAIPIAGGSRVEHAVGRRDQCQQRSVFR